MNADAPPEPEGAVRVLVSGLVQGVGFRWHSVEQARAAGLSGWVRNLDDGRVEAHLQGPREGIDNVVAWMRRGPRHARVAGLAVADAPLEPGLHGFHERR